MNRFTSYIVRLGLASPTIQITSPGRISGLAEEVHLFRLLVPPLPGPLQHPHLLLEAINGLAQLANGPRRFPLGLGQSLHGRFQAAYALLGPVLGCCQLCIASYLSSQPPKIGRRVFNAPATSSTWSSESSG